jgi:2-polyprenyl-6-methoxyphenol hydroxylase-like FAD-dependent oxidoreductase
MFAVTPCNNSALLGDKSVKLSSGLLSWSTYPKEVTMKTIIVGGGIGGMALAASLQKLGRDVLVLEQAPQLGEVGSGLGVLPGAVRALRAIGVSENLFTQAATLQLMRISNHKGRDLSRLDLTKLFAKLGENGYIMRRTALHGALAACVSSSSIRTNARVSRVQERDNLVDVFVEGESAPMQADLVIGADGLRSVVRKYVLGESTPRYAGETILRGISELPTAPISREIFGPGRRLGYYNIGNNQTYFWATSPEPQGTQIAPQDRKKYLQDCFAGWAFDIPALIEKTPEDRILQNDIFDRPSASIWHKGRVVLLGDAAHPTTPNMGQGACMAIEDSVVLARSLTSSDSLEKSFRAYEQARVSRTSMITRLSKIWGHVGLWDSQGLMWFRDAFYGLTPDAVFARILQDQYSYHPGALS